MPKNNFPTRGPIIIGTNDIKRSKEFYIAVFGITIEREEPMYISAHLTDGTHIELEADSPERFPNWVKHNVGTYKNSEFFVLDIHAFIELVLKHGGSVVVSPVARSWGGFGAEIADPDGNIMPISQK